QLDLSGERVPGGVGERCLARQSGVVDQHVNVQALLVGVSQDRCRGGGVGEVGGEDLTSDLVLFGELGGEVVEAVGAAGDQQQLVAAGGQVAGERRADACGGAADERGAG